MEISQTIEQSTHEAPTLPSTSGSSDCSVVEFTVQEGEPAQPHEALFFVLAYLPVFELLSMSEACKSLRDAVKEDVLPWLNIVVERPLSCRLSDKILMELASMANGKLKTLALMNCVKITDDGLQSVVEKNPLIDKVIVVLPFFFSFLSSQATLEADFSCVKFLC